MTFADGSAERIANYAGGSPYVARLICLYAASMANADRQTSISLDHINRGAERVVQEWHERMPSAIKRRLEHPRSTAQEDLLLAAAVASDVNHSRSEEHTSELQSLMRISYAVFCLKKKKKKH